MPFPRTLLVALAALAAALSGAAVANPGLPLTDPHGRLARESPGPSTRRTGITFSEVHHQPSPRPDGRDLRFIELYNSNPFPEDLSGWSLAGDVDYLFPPGTHLAGLGYLLVAPSPSDIESVHGITNVIGGFPTGLGPDRGFLRLRKRSGAIVLQTEFTMDAAWEVASQGGGPSRVLARPSLGEGNPLAWSASVFVGGSPGGPEPLLPTENAGVLVNEILAEPAGSIAPFVEVHNRSALPADLSGAALAFSTDTFAAPPPAPDLYRFPPGSVLPAGGFLAVQAATLDSGLHPEGGLVFLVSSDGSRILDARRYGGLHPGHSFGRLPDDSASWQTTRHPTPGTTNAPARLPDLVLSEIHFAPLRDDENEEFIEIHNRSAAAVALDHWQIAGGITFRFLPGSVLGPGEFLAIARNPTRLRDQHPDLPPSRFTGGFQGSLRNGGERLLLLRPIPWTDAAPGPEPRPPWRHLAVEEEVSFLDRSRWHHWADGGGSSLERVDLEAPARESGNWRDSDESTKAPWMTVQATGALTLPHPGVPSASQLQILLLGAGEALIDDVEVLANGVQRIANGRFDSGTHGWFFQGTHRLSRVDPGAGSEGSPALHLIASDRGDHVANRIRTVLTSPLAVNAVATIRARVRWLKGHPEILFRLRNGGLEAFGSLPIPPGSGTPAAPNSRASTNAPPAIALIRHHPVLPAGNQAVRVFARASDPHGLDRVELLYRRDPATSLTTLPMIDDGTGGDEFGGDGVHTATLPGQPAGSLIAFHVRATDPRGAAGTFPEMAGPSGREGLIRFGETTAPGAFGSYRIWMTAATRDAWTRREKMSNEDLDVTFVSGNDRVIYNAGAHYSGSSYTSPTYDSPTGALCGYDLSFPPDDRFLGADRATLDWPIRDATNQREQLMFWFLEQFGLPNLHRRYVRLTVNGVRRGTLYDDVQQPDGDTVESWYPDDDEGSLWKTDCWNEFDNAGARIDPCVLNTLERFPASGPKKVARYRWNWRPRAVRGSANDFSDLFALVDAANATSQYVPTVEALIDIDHWMRTFAMNDLASYWDGFGNPNAKNTFLYKPRHGRWQLFSWDFDVGLGVFNDPPDAALFDVEDPTLARMYRTPALVRPYWAAMREAVDTWFRTGGNSPVDRFLDARYAAFQTNNVSLSGPAPIKSWISQRRAYLLQQLARVRSDFALTSQNGADFSTSEETVTLSGRAPVNVATIRIQGRDRAVTWTTVSNWTARVTLAPGVNDLLVEGIDRLGNPLSAASDSVRITYTGAAGPLPRLRINEWLAQNAGIFVNPVTGDPDDWFELFNAGSTTLDLSGYSLTDRLQEPTRYVIPAGFSLPPGAFLLVWADENPGATRPGGALHTSFRLSLDGEDIAVFDPLGRLVDSVTFGPQPSDASEGRWPDGAPPPFPRFTLPTPGQANATSPGSLPGFLVAARVDSSGPNGPHVRLTWRTVPGRAYQPEFTRNLVNPVWEPFGEARTAQGGMESVTDPAPMEALNFYRVRLLP